MNRMGNSLRQPKDEVDWIQTYEDKCKNAQDLVNDVKTSLYDKLKTLQSDKIILGIGYFVNPGQINYWSDHTIKDYRLQGQSLETSRQLKIGTIELDKKGRITAVNRDELDKGDFINIVCSKNNECVCEFKNDDENIVVNPFTLNNIRSANKIG